MTARPLLWCLLVPALLLAACSHAANETIRATGSATDLQAEALLEGAMSAAAAYYASGATFVGFGDDASVLEPSITWNRDPAAVVGQVSIRGESTQSVVLVTKSATGAVFCAGLSGTGVTTKGPQDASGAAACSGGW